MPRDFFPRREADIVHWTANFSAKINAAAEDYGISPQRAADYAIVQQAFADAYRRAQDPGTDSSTAHAGKAAALTALQAATRPLVKTIKGTPTVTGEMRIDLGLRPKLPRRRQIPAPAAAPILRVVEVVGSVLKVRLIDATSPRRGRPRDVAMAQLYAFAGDGVDAAEAPPDLHRWRFKGSTAGVLAEVRFDSSIPPGTQVWLTARWLSPTAQPGPTADPVFAYLQHGVVQQRLAVPRLAVAQLAA